MKKLLVYLSRQKTAPDYIKNKDFFCYPFAHSISRTNYKVEHFNFNLACESVSDLKRHNYTKTDFTEIMHLRAKSLLAMNKNIYYFFYSGGLDSTAMLVAVLKTWPTADLKKIKLVMTTSSILENISFFKNFLLQFDRLNYFDEIKNIFAQENGLIVTGELGDQLFGAGLLMSSVKKLGDDFLFKNYKDHAATALQHYFSEDTKRGDIDSKKILELYLPIVDECPFPIKTNFDFFWWFNFTQEWQFAKYKYLEHLDCPLSIRYNEQITHFYDNLDMQMWSLYNQDQKIDKNWHSYQWATKKFIHDFTKDPFHLRQPKLQSLKNTYFFQSFRIAINDEIHSVENLDDLRSYAK